MLTPCRRLLPLLLPLALCWQVGARAEDIVFPPDSGVVDVTKSPYFAKGDGVTDDTEALQQALLERGGGNRILYLPNGTYRLSGTLRWPGGDGDTETGATILQGQSREKTIIQLLDYTDAFNNSGKPRPMVWTGAGGQKHYRNAVRNLTLHTGAGNVGAIGLQFIANKQGCVRDVDIIAGGDGAGAMGLDLSYIENIGPLLVKGVRIRGFDSAIRTGNPVLSVTFEDVEFTGQKLVGLRNSAQVISVRHLRSTNSVPALQNTDNLGFVTLLDSTLQGLPSRRPGPALVNRGLMFVRNVQTPGYTNAVENRSGHADGAPGPEVQEYTSHNIFTIFAAPPFSLGLPVEETPELPWDPPSAWAGPQSFGGKPDDQLDDSAAIQAAIDSGATTVYLPNGTWIIRKPVELNHKVRRIIGCEAHLIVATPPGQPGFRVGDETAGTVLFERLEVDALKSPLVEFGAEKRIVFSSCFGVSLNWKARGTVFLEDVATFTPWKMGTNQTLWARQWCLGPETPAKLANDGGTAWLFGFMTERAGTLVSTKGGGKTEVLGGLCLSSGGFKTTPMFSVNDASTTFIIAEASLAGSPYQTVVEETRDGVTRRMSNFGTAGDQTLPVRVGGIAVPLFTAYNGVGAVEPRTTPNKPKKPR